MDDRESTAPVSTRSEVDIAADPLEVWRVIADVEGWPAWNPAVREVSLDGDLETGTYFRWAAGPGTLTSRLTLVDAPRRLAWDGAFMTLRHRYSWRIEPHPGGSQVTVDVTISGLAARLLATRVRQNLRADVETWMDLLRLESESRHSSATAGVSSDEPVVGAPVRTVQAQRQPVGPRGETS